MTNMASDIQPCANAASETTVRAISFDDYVRTYVNKSTIADCSETQNVVLPIRDMKSMMTKKSLCSYREKLRRLDLRAATKKEAESKTQTMHAANKDEQRSDVESAVDSMGASNRLFLTLLVGFSIMYLPIVIFFLVHAYKEAALVPAKPSIGGLVMAAAAIQNDLQTSKDEPSFVGGSNDVRKIPSAKINKECDCEASVLLKADDTENVNHLNTSEVTALQLAIMFACLYLLMVVLSFLVSYFLENDQPRREQVKPLQ